MLQGIIKGHLELRWASNYLVTDSYTFMCMGFSNCDSEDSIRPLLLWA